MNMISLTSHNDIQPLPVKFQLTLVVEFTII